MSLRPENLRVVTLDLGSVSPPEGHPDFGNPVVIQAFAIESPRGVVLVDTGPGGPEATIDRLYRPERRALDLELRANTITRERITAVVASHLHFDHVGALSEFPGIPIHVQRAELQAARRDPGYTILSRIPNPALQYVEHDGDAEVCDGVRAVATPGHTPEHQSVIVDTADGVVVLACQAAYVLEEWIDSSFEHPAGAASAWNPGRYKESMNKLRAANPIEARFTHDRRIWKKADLSAASPDQKKLTTDAGLLTIQRAGLADFQTVMAILREAADWLSARGNAQWKHWHMEVGEKMLRDRIEHHEVYLARRDGVAVGTLTIQWSDPDQWGERGLDGRAGYIHGLAITRSVGGMGIGERLLQWAVERIIGQGRQVARLDAQASNAPLCRYYEQRGFRRLETATLFGGMYTAQLFERELAQPD